VVTHQDKQTGAWVPNAPVLSGTKTGWRMGGTSNGLVIREQGPYRYWGSDRRPGTPKRICGKQDK
jgi:hypothetical protein